MIRTCPNPDCACPDFTVRDGFFRRREDSKTIQRYRCQSCKTRFSSATFSENYYQKKRRINSPLLKLLCSGMSLRRSAIFLGITKRTAARKLPILALRCRKLNDRHLIAMKGKVFNIQIDKNKRKILALEVSQIPAFGHLSKFAIKK